MIKAGQKRKQSNTETVAKLFCNPSTAAICDLLLKESDETLRAFFKDLYGALEALAGETTKAAIGLGDPEKVIKEAGINALPVVRKLGARISELAEVNND
jgi:hypothetical protein